MLIKKDNNKQQEIAGQARNDDSLHEMRQLESDFDKAIKALTEKKQNNEIPE
jgi:hypothetical protein